jgi:hypothetical protein
MRATQLPPAAVGSVLCPAGTYRLDRPHFAALRWVRHFCLNEAFVKFGRMRSARAICRLVLAAMLFAQATGVAQACSVVAHSPTMAFAPTQHEGDCGKTVNQNACLQQCTAGDQSSAQVQVAVAPMPALPVLVVDVAPLRVACPAIASTSLFHSTDPPRSIRFCSFQL